MSFNFTCANLKSEINFLGNQSSVKSEANANTWKSRKSFASP